ncbi:signal recognition particle-docking protein FtsY [Corynebacterium urealyticum]|uniref:Signal recognition particle receptor FtsY n=1 Tax=Corynebacterium urealyticum (strain ATCC 43042 / DSM 7109) TaxID=504474 RepID=B1VG65_CORU7|nr:signal recognition particle-docking protein FtsY [Corynebacterium urealyticum]QQC41775.1 signal recognition particle-docking protein FtsY [Corynebacterium urealyticum]CAQ04754.1 signal recognition particle receptor [Corynebacterium urealyticum DSM 7109]SNV81261.1 signal recognition particle receptor [Corynebacterium urealyticum]
MNVFIWVLIGLVVLAAIVAIVVVLGLRRNKSKQISFEKSPEIEKKPSSGDYQAKGGFNFTSGGESPAPTSEEAGRPTMDIGGVSVPAPFEKEKEAQPHGEAPAEASEKPAPAKAEPEQPAAEKADADETSPAAAEEEKPAEPAAPAELAVPAAEQGEPDAEKAAEDPQGEQAGSEKPVEAEPAEKRETTAPVDVPAPPAAAPEEAAAEKEAEKADAAAADTAENGSVDEVADGATPAEKQEAARTQEIAPVEGRLGKLRGRMAKSQNVIGRGVLGILSAGDLDEDAWEEIEDTLLMADLGADTTMKVVDSLRERIASQGVESEEQARAMLREVLIEAGKPELDRSIKAMPYKGKPGVIMVVGVNGTGKTTTTGKLSRVLVGMGKHVVLGAADTFRAAAADQLETWGNRVGARTVRGKEGADPASVAFDSVSQGMDEQADVVLVDTAGRLHTSVGLMDQLGKVKRVVEKRARVDEVLLVLDATVGQNGLMQARVFRDVVDITGVVLTKLDGTAKGGIVFQVQEELGVPVKLVGLGEGADDLAPFEVESFVDALLG